MVIGHVLRNALIPAVTLLGLSVGYLMGGTVIVENVFSLPGAGKLLVESSRHGTTRSSNQRR